MNADELISRHLLGIATPEESHDLAAWVRASPANADRLARDAFVHRAVRDQLRGQAWLDSLDPVSSDRVSTLQSRAGGRLIPRIAAAAAVLVAVLGIGYLSLREQAETAPSWVKPLVIPSPGAAWSSTLVEGQLPAGNVTLTSGIARICAGDETDFVVASGSTIRLDGKTLVLTGSGRIAVRSRGDAALQAGEVTVSGSGEFGISVAGATRIIHCVAGQARVTGVTDVPTNLSPGQTLALGNLPTIPFPPLWAEARLAERYGHLPSRSMLKDPALIFWCDLGRRDGGTPLATADALSVDPAARVLPSPIAARPAPGRDIDPALRIAGASGGIPVEIDGTYEELTLAAFVRLDTSPAKQTHRGLLMSDGWGQPGQVHWQVKGADFRLSFFDRGDDADARYPASADALGTPGWHHLVTVIRLRGADRGVRHYVDGRLVARQPLDTHNATALHVGRATIGGWVPPVGREHENRTLQGDIDDVMVFRRALTDAEVNALHHQLVQR